MKNSFQRFLFIIILIIPGCALIAPPPTVEDNIFTSYDVPKIMIKVSDKLKYRKKLNNSNIGTSDEYSLTAKGISTESYVFTDYRSVKGVVIMIEKFSGPAGNWYMLTPDYSSLPGTEDAGTVDMNGVSYYTGIQVTETEEGRFINKYYGRVFGSADDVRLQIIYLEKLDISSPTSIYIEQFSSRADKSFTILPYTAILPARTTENEKNNEFLQQNADKTDGTSCRDSLECAKGYFCVNHECKKGFTD